MSEIKALDELREYAEQCCPTYEDYDAKMMEIADAVEAEIAERYMELPVDAYGVPIRPDDPMACTAFDTNDFDGKEHVMAVGNGFWVDKDGCTHIPSETRHVKPRTLEDVLRECGKSYYAHMTDNYMNYDGTDDQLIAKYAAEIREMMKDVS